MSDLDLGGLCYHRNNSGHSSLGTGGASGVSCQTLSGFSRRTSAWLVLKRVCCAKRELGCSEREREKIGNSVAGFGGWVFTEISKIGEPPHNNTGILLTNRDLPNHTLVKAKPNKKAMNPLKKKICSGYVFF